MNNVVPIHNKPEAFNDESELYFDVWERPSYFIGKPDRFPGTNYYEDPNHKHIVRMYNGSPISIGLVGRNYKLLKNKELCESIEETFMDTLTHEELHGVTRGDNISYLGGTCIRDYIFPGINADISSKRSEIAFRTIVINGYNFF